MADSSRCPPVPEIRVLAVCSGLGGWYVCAECQGWPRPAVCGGTQPAMLIALLRTVAWGTQSANHMPSLKFSACTAGLRTCLLPLIAHRHPCSVHLQEGFSSVLEDRTPFNSHASREHHHEHISLYHFVLKSREDFANKAMRGGAAGKFRDWGFFDDIDNQAVVNCSEALLGPQWPIQNEDEHPPGIQPARHHRTLLI